MSERVKELMDTIYGLNPKELSISRYKDAVTIEATWRIEMEKSE